VSRNALIYPVYGIEERCFRAIDDTPKMIVEYGERGLLSRKSAEKNSTSFKLFGPIRITGRLKRDLCGRFSISLTALNRCMFIRAHRPDLEPEVRAGRVSIHAAFVSAGGKTDHVERNKDRGQATSIPTPLRKGDTRLRRLTPNIVVSGFIESIRGLLVALEGVSDVMTDEHKQSIKPYIKRLRRVVAVNPKEAPGE